jgi:gluconokinase
MMVVVVMGVAGSGKSTVGALIAQGLGADFAEGDRFHPAANIAKMSAGQPLDDADRLPWLEAMAAAIRGWRQAQRPTVLACSALKQSYRDLLRGGADEVRFVHLRATRAQVESRMATRRGHFMPTSLIASQFATLEEPSDAIAIDVAGTPETIAQAALRRLAAGDG